LYPTQSGIYNHLFNTISTLHSLYHIKPGVLQPPTNLASLLLKANRLAGSDLTGFTDCFSCFSGVLDVDDLFFDGLVT